jgi:hypothetical protein
MALHPRRGWVSQILQRFGIPQKFLPLKIKTKPDNTDFYSNYNTCITIEG